MDDVRRHERSVAIGSFDGRPRIVGSRSAVGRPGQEMLVTFLA
ncbi:hypothetical protein [Pseudonocardia sp. GCM10023141]